MAARKNNADFTATVVPDLPAAAQQTGKTQWNVKLAKAQEELKAAKAQLAAANQVLAKLQAHPPKQKPAAPARHLAAVKKTASPPAPPAHAPTHSSAHPPALAAKAAAEDEEDLEFKVEVPESTDASAIKSAIKKNSAKPCVIKIDLDGDHAKLPEQPLDAGNRLENPAAVASGDYLHGELGGDADESPSDGDFELPTTIRQGVVFNLSSYSAAGVAPAMRRAAGFMIDFALTIAISFIFMPSAQMKYYINFAADLYHAFLDWLASPIFQLGYVIESVTSGQMGQLSFNFDLFTKVFHTYVPMLDLRSLMLIGLVWTVTTTVALGFWDSTLGQKVLHMKIIHAHRPRLGWPRALLRQTVFFPISMISIIGLVMAFTGSKRCWHDHMSGCKVTLF